MRINLCSRSGSNGAAAEVTSRKSPDPLEPRRSMNLPAVTPTFQSARFAGWKTGVTNLNSFMAPKRERCVGGVLLTSSATNRRFIGRAQAAFTMIEIAISLAVIAFALVAIIGVLPTGMSVQTDNREDTIINQDGPYWLDAIRSGSKGLDNLTNYVERIGVVTIKVDLNKNPVDIIATNPPDYSVYDRLDKKTGSNIVGLLSLPKFSTNYTGRSDVQVFSVQAQVRALTGSATEQGLANPDFAFSYLLVSEIVPFHYFAPDSTNFTAYPANSTDWIVRSNRWMEAFNMRANSHEARLTFRWPFLSEGRTGPGRQTFRSVIAGQLRPEIEKTRGSPLYFFQPQTYVQQP